MKKRSVQLFLGILFLTGLLSAPVLTVSAQAPKRTGAVASNKKPPVKKCSGAWTGVITFTRSQRQENTKREERVSARGFDTDSYEIKADYVAQVVVTEDPTREGGSVGHATVDHSYAFTKKVEATEKNSCDRGKTWRDMKGTFTEKTEFTGRGDDVNASVHVGVGADGRYQVGVGLPQLPGKIEGMKTSVYSGQCTKKEGVNEKLPETPRTVDGRSLTSDGRNWIDPKTADQISGTYSIDYPGGVVETITWNLRRCGGPLMVTEVKFYHPLYPSPNSWIEVKDHTNDGNIVRIVAKVANLSGQSKTTHINFKELKSNTDLAEGKIQLNLKPNEEREVEYVWDTSGYAWKEGTVWNEPEINRKIEVSVTEDVKVADVQVQPKPVIVIPGLFSKPELISRFIGTFKSIPTTEWHAQVAPVSVWNTAAENAPIIDETVRSVQKDLNAWHVDLVGHSTGGLMARAYVQGKMPKMFDGRPGATHLVMVGTPNMGTPCSTGVETIYSRIFHRNSPSFNEISIRSMKTFNERVKRRNGTKFSILVGNGFDPNCQMDGPGDGITPNRSAIWTIKTWKFATVRTRHEDLIGHHPHFTQIIHWLAVGPKGNHNPEREDIMGRVVQEGPTIEPTLNRRHYGASYKPFDLGSGPMIGPMVGDEDSEPDFATGVKVAPGKSVEVPIKVTKGSKLSVTFIAPPNVSVTLTDAAGLVVGKIHPGTPEAEGFFRTITVRKPFEDGMWKLTLENEERTEAEIAIIAFIDFNSNIFLETK